MYSSQKEYCEVSIDADDIKNLIKDPGKHFDNIWERLSVRLSVLVLLQYLSPIHLDLQGLYELMKLERTKTDKIVEYLKACRKDWKFLMGKIDKLNEGVSDDIKERIKNILDEIRHSCLFSKEFLNTCREIFFSLNFR